MESEQDWFSGSSHEKQRFKIPDTKGKGRTLPIPVSLHQAGVPLPASLLTQRVCSSTISTSDANDPMGIISMLFLFVKQSAFICRTFIKNGSGKGRNGCTKFLPRLSSYSPRHSLHVQSGNVLLSQVISSPCFAHRARGTIS